MHWHLKGAIAYVSDEFIVPVKFYGRFYITVQVCGMLFYSIVGRTAVVHTVGNWRALWPFVVGTSKNVDHCQVGSEAVIHTV